jgi:hypothetical protein
MYRRKANIRNVLERTRRKSSYGENRREGNYEEVVGLRGISNLYDKNQKKSETPVLLLGTPSR